MQKKGAKRKKKKQKNYAKYPTIHFPFFTFSERFPVFCGKCIAGLSHPWPTLENVG